MARFNVSVAIRVWVDKEVIAPTEEEARNKVERQAKQLPNQNGFSWVDGSVNVLGSMNLSLLRKIPNFGED